MRRRRRCAEAGAALAVLAGVLGTTTTADTAGAGVTGKITFYPQPLGVTPTAITGTPVGTLFYGAEEGSGERGMHFRRITTGGTFDGDVYAAVAGDYSHMPGFYEGQVAAAPGGGAYMSDATFGAYSDASLNVSELPLSRNLYTGVAVASGTPYWGYCTFNEDGTGNYACPNPTDIVGNYQDVGLEQGFPSATKVSTTAAWVSSMLGDGSAVDFVLGQRYPGFHYLGTTYVCNGGAYPFAANSKIVDMALGASGEWFADATRDSVWNETGPCTAVEYSVPDSTTPRNITAGVDGNAYFTTSSGIWKVTPTGHFTQYVDPSLVDPKSITSGSDGEIWFTDSAGHQIGKLDIKLPFGSLSPQILRFGTVLNGQSETGTIRIRAPRRIIRVSSTNSDFVVPTPSHLRAPPNLNVGCPRRCYLGVTFAPPVGTPAGPQNGKLTVVLRGGSTLTFPMQGTVKAP